MEDDEDIKIVYESCDNEEWRAARELLKNQYKIAIETGMPIKSEMPEDGNGHIQIWRPNNGTSYHSSATSSSRSPSTSSEYGTTTDVNQDMDPLFVKMELIDVLDGDGDSSSVELLQEDSDSTVSDGTVLREPCDRAAFRTRFSERDDLSEPVHEKDLAERNVRNGVSAFSETSRSRSTKQSKTHPSIPPTSTSFGSAMQSASTLSATEIWREACRSNLSTSSATSEYQEQLPFFVSAQSSKSVASSFLRGVDGLRIDDPDSSQPRSPLPISHDEVTSSSDVTKPVSEREREMAIASRWAETHDLQINDGDEFLECDDEQTPSQSGVQRVLTEEGREVSGRRKTSPRKYHCKHHKRSSRSIARAAAAAAAEKEKVSETAPQRENDSPLLRSTENLRKRNSSPTVRVRSSSRNRAQDRKRFASDRSHDRRRKERTPQTASTSRRSETTRKRSFAASTSSALRARGLPRYKPAPRKYDFTRWLDSNGDLVLHKISDVATGQVSGPLGCTYDSALDTFVFTRHDSILFASSDGKVLENLTLKGFDQPCALCILQPGAAMGILDRSHLYLYEAKFRRLSIIASGLAGRHRALTFTSNGDFVTVKRISQQLCLMIFDATEHNKIVGCFPYPVAEGVPPDFERQPCFADSAGNQMFFTDLRTNTLTCMELFGNNRLEKVYSRCMQHFPSHRGEEALKRFMFMSGIRCDDSGHLLIADAKAHMLKLMTSSGQLLKCARFVNGASFPYCSAFGVSPSGLLMACDRGNNRMVLFRIGEESLPEDAVITDDVFDRMMGEHGVEREVRRLKERARRCV